MVDVTKLGESIVVVIKTFVAEQVGALSKRVDALLVRLDSMPAPKDGKDGKDGRDGVDGKSVEPVEVEALVLRAVEALPPAKDGASVTLDDVAPVIADQVKAAVAEIPIPQNGKDVDPEVVAELVRAEVAKIPPPADGKSVTVDDVAPIIERHVKAAVEAIPKPVDGKDAEPLDQGAVVKDVLAAIRVPEDGKSVAPADVEPMLSDLVAKAVGAIPKPKDGESVPIDQVQKMIDEALSKAMAAVQMPKDGEHGRDAMDIEILPAINETRRYARGTYASHKGGVWVARRSTDGMDGWACIVNGVTDITVDQHQDDPRKFFVSIGTAAGIDAVKEFVIPAMVYKGVFREGDEFTPGDVVTWGGSLWHCNEPTKDKPIEGSMAWRLAAKRGRDGKDGTNGKDLTKGVSIK